MARRVIQYNDLDAAPGETSLSGAASGYGAGLQSTQQQREQPKQQQQQQQQQWHWTAEGQPISASAARKYRKVLTLLADGQTERAQLMLEESSMSPAFQSMEIREALARARQRTSGANGSGSSGRQHQKQDWLGYDDDGNADDDGDTIYEEDGELGVIAPGTSFAWQGASQMGDNGGRQLTHAEIWDDSALTDAWDAAMEEYKQFDKKRTEAHAGLAAAAPHVNGSTTPARKSALWHDSPVAGSLAAAEAKAAATSKASYMAQQSQAESRAAAAQAKELEERKQHARMLLDHMDTSASEKARTWAAPAPVSTATQDVVAHQPPPPKKRRKVKGVVPPSSNIAGNTAWHLACATVSQTPNQIGDEQRSDKDIPAIADRTDADRHAANGAAHEKGASAPTSFAHGNAGGNNEVLQNLAMSWYYAGYYQAMALGMMSSQPHETSGSL